MLNKKLKNIELIVCKGIELKFISNYSLASIPIIIIMLVAIATTKAQVLKNDGFWEMLHGSRTDWAMLLGGIFLLIEGAGKWSFDKKLNKNGGEK